MTLADELHDDLQNYGAYTLQVYFVPYILFEVPSNMVFRKLNPAYYLSFLMFSWSIINMCMGFVTSYEGLVVLRFFLGAFEAGVMPGIVYLTSMYYKRHEFQTRMSFFFCSTVIGGAFGGVCGFLIYLPAQVIFCPLSRTCIPSLLLPFRVPTYPQSLHNPRILLLQLNYFPLASCVRDRFPRRPTPPSWLALDFHHRRHHHHPRRRSLLFPDR